MIRSDFSTRGQFDYINKKPDIATMSGARMPIYASQ